MRMRNAVTGGLGAAFLLLAPFEQPAAAEPELISTRRIWDAAPHNAFTDLVRFRGRWFCTFREGAGHVSPDGSIRVLTSSDGESWTSAALLSSSTGDLRDPKFAIAPGNRLMLIAASAVRGAAPSLQTLAWFSKDGARWSEAVPIGEPNLWLWRITWHKGRAYGAGYGNIDGREIARLYSSRDGRQFTTLVETLLERGYPNESSIMFLDDSTALCLLRRDGSESSAQLGTARPPYTEWAWKDLGVRLGGPHMLRLRDGRIVAAGRLYDGNVRTALCWLDPRAGTLTEFLALPSGGDTSYPGLVFHDGLLWVSYYASHEGKTSIYLARVKLP